MDVIDLANGIVGLFGQSQAVEVLGDRLERVAEIGARVGLEEVTGIGRTAL